MTNKDGRVGSQPVTARDRILRDVFTDEEFRFDIQILHEYQKRFPEDGGRISEIAEGIAQKWDLRPDEFNHLSIGTVIYLEAPISGARLEFHRETMEPIIRLSMDSSMEQVQSIYRQFDEFRKMFGYTAAKRKEPSYPDVTYKVFKGVQVDGKSYEQIHTELTDPKSEQYNDRIARIFLTPQELRKYYNRHKG